MHHGDSHEQESFVLPEPGSQEGSDPHGALPPAGRDLRGLGPRVDPTIPEVAPADAIRARDTSSGSR